jgi:hypothetical protein
MGGLPLRAHKVAMKLHELGILQERQPVPCSWALENDKCSQTINLIRGAEHMLNRLLAFMREQDGAPGAPPVEKPAEPIKDWFDALEKMRAKLWDESRDTEEDLKEFSRQKLSDILVGDLKHEFDRFCLAMHIGSPSAYYDGNMDKTFLWILDKMTYRIESTLLSIMFEVGKKYNQDIGKRSPTYYEDRPLQDLFGPDDFDSNQGLKEMHDLLLQKVPTVFYPISSAILKKTDQTAMDAINKILQK